MKKKIKNAYLIVLFAIMLIFVSINTAQMSVYAICISSESEFESEFESGSTDSNVIQIRSNPFINAEKYNKQDMRKQVHIKKKYRMQHFMLHDGCK